MHIVIRKIEESENRCLGVLKSSVGGGTYFVCFQDNIFGMIALNHFIEMVRHRFNAEHIELKIVDDEIKIKNKILFDFIKKSGDKKENNP